MPVRELVELMLGVTGKDAVRVQDLLRRGALVSGASRFRWQGWETGRSQVESLLATFPDPEPARTLNAARIVRAVIRGPSARIDISREAGARRRWFRRASFWDALVAVASDGSAGYVDYSYRERADLYRVPLTAEFSASIRDAAARLVWTTLRDRIHRASLDAVEFYVER